MERAKGLILAGLGAMAALTIYGAAATKKAGLDNGHNDRLKRIEALMDEGAVKYRPSFFHTSAKKPHHLEEKIAALEPVKAASEVAPPKAPDKKAEDAKKAAEKKAADEKKKKEDEAKKKKKKKKKDGKTDEAPASPQEASKDDDKKKDDSSGVSGGDLAGPASALSGGGTAVNANPQTADEWIAYLMNNATFEKFSKFIQLAQTGVVKLEVFYPVVEKVLSTDGGRYHEFGTLCLGSVVTSQSFELLSEVANEATMEDKTKLQARTYMLKYARVEYVRFLGMDAVGDNAQAANDAINVIKASIVNLQGVTVAATPTTSATTRAPAASVTAIYEALKAALQQAALSANDGSVKANAGNVAQAVASALSTAEAATPSAIAPTTVGSNN